MKNKDKHQQPAKPSSPPSNSKQNDPQITNKNPRKEDRGSIDKEIDKRTAENRTPKGENL
jgi:hypothetical protein